MIQRANPVRSLVIPYLLGGMALAIAFVGALLTVDDNVTGGANGFVELLSGRSTSLLGNIGLLAPLGLAFAAGMVATVNPCGFAMLPAYLGLYMGSGEESAKQTNAVERLGVSVGTVRITSRLSRKPHSAFKTTSTDTLEHRIQISTISLLMIQM